MISQINDEFFLNNYMALQLLARTLNHSMLRLHVIDELENDLDLIEASRKCKGVRVYARVEIYFVDFNGDEIDPVMYSPLTPFFEAFAEDIINMVAFADPKEAEKDVRNMFVGLVDCAQRFFNKTARNLELRDKVIDLETRHLEHDS